MDEAYVRLLCPECDKNWDSTPSDLPEHTQVYDCPTCDASRRLAEFMRTDRDLQTLKTF
jgi:ssDNA-binding Zn-finger/Zn-ribbon topoisomerase 1